MLKTKIIKIIIAAILFFLCGIGLRKDKKNREKELYEKMSDGTRSQGIVDYENERKGNMPLKNEWGVRNLKDLEDIRSGMGGAVLLRYLDWICFLGGVVCLGMLWSEVTDNPYKDIILKWIILGMVILICISVGVVQYLRTDIGKDTKKITGIVTNTYLKMCGYGDYRIDVAWTDEKNRKRLYKCTYNFRKHNLPKVGSEYELIYSYRYDNVKSDREIRQGRRYSFYGFGLAVFWIIILLLNLL